MGFSAQLTSEQLNEIIEYQKNTDKSAREVQEQVEKGEEVLDPENTSSIPNKGLYTINNPFEHDCLDELVRL
jgi:phosphosulfolactate synthase (CoM biosynthesis protein A)